MIDIIEAKEHHEEELGNLWMEWMRFHQDIDPVSAPKDGSIPVFIEKYLRPAMRAEDSLVLVALDEGKVIGYSYSFIVVPHELTKREEYGFIHDMIITTAHRRMGVGGRMMAEIDQWFRANNIGRVELDVMAQNRVGAAFWKKHGFMDFQRKLCRQI